MNVADDEIENPDKTVHAPIPRGLERQVTITNDQMNSHDLFVGTRDIVIVHGRDAYHLRLTGQNKLILTK